MSMHLQQEIEHLKGKLLTLVATAKGAVEKAVKSVDERDAALAQAVVDGDFEIDRAEVNLEEDCLKILALYQPVATNLRVIVSVMKMNNDIERIGDLAVNIAERALFLCGEAPVEAPSDLAKMRAKALAMLTRSLDALVRLDTKCAREVRAADDEVDDINRQLFREFAAAVRRNPDHVESLLSYLSVGRHLERIADYATNIAEDVIYLMEGEIVRHKPTLPGK
jgi:phosphate transport system regulatory protein PhoU